MKRQDHFLYVKQTNGRYAIADPDEVVQSAHDIVASLYQRDNKTAISSPIVAREQLYLMMHREHEVFVAMFLDSKHRIIKAEELFRGTIDCCSVPVREIVKEALKCNAAALIVAHNHPSGVSEPSMADKALTEAIYLALNMVGVKLLDHFIFGSGGYENAVSFAEIGSLN